MHGSDPGQIGTSAFGRVGKVLGKETRVPVFHQTNSEIRLTADTEGQLCKDGSQGGEVQEEMINTRDLQVLGVSDALWK